MNKGLEKISIVFLAILVLGLIFQPSATAENSQVKVSIPDVSSETEETTIVPINVNNVKELGAATIELHYNSALVNVESISNGDLGSLTTSIDNTAGVAKMSWFSTSGRTGDFVFTNVKLKITGSEGETNLNLRVNTLVDTEANPIPHEANDGELTIAAQTNSKTTINETPAPSPSPNSITPTETPGATETTATKTPTETPKETKTPQKTLTPTITPKEIQSPGSTPKPNKTIADKKPKESTEPSKGVPGFEAIISIAGLLSVALLTRKIN